MLILEQVGCRSLAIDGLPLPAIKTALARQIKVQQQTKPMAALTN